MNVTSAERAERVDRPADDVAARLVELTQSINRFRNDLHNAAPGEGDVLLMHLLFRVLDDGPMRMGELAETTKAEPSTVSRQVATLVSRGLLERRADPQDGRASILHATAAGIAYRDRRISERNERFGELLQGWTVADQRQFAGLLARFNHDFALYRNTWLAALTTKEPASGRATA